MRCENECDCCGADHYREGYDAAVEEIVAWIRSEDPDRDGCLADAIEQGAHVPPPALPPPPIVVPRYWQEVTYCLRCDNQFADCTCPPMSI